MRDRWHPSKSPLFPVYTGIHYKPFADHVPPNTNQLILTKYQPVSPYTDLEPSSTVSHTKLTWSSYPTFCSSPSFSHNSLIIIYQNLTFCWSVPGPPTHAVPSIGVESTPQVNSDSLIIWKLRLQLEIENLKVDTRVKVNSACLVICKQGWKSIYECTLIP